MLEVVVWLLAKAVSSFRQSCVVRLFPYFIKTYSLSTLHLNTERIPLKLLQLSFTTSIRLY